MTLASPSSALTASPSPVSENRGESEDTGGSNTVYAVRANSETDESLDTRFHVCFLDGAQDVGAQLRSRSRCRTGRRVRARQSLVDDLDDVDGGILTSHSYDVDLIAEHTGGDALDSMVGM